MLLTAILVTPILILRIAVVTDNYSPNISLPGNKTQFDECIAKKVK